MADELVSTNPASGRTAIIEVAGEALWLYLTEPSSGAIACDCWLANLGPNREPLTDETRAALRAAGNPPPAAPNALRDPNWQPPTDPQDYTLDWSENGEAVRALAGDQPVAFIDASEKRGFHANIGAECPWGHVFQEDRYRQLFGAR